MLAFFIKRLQKLKIQQILIMQQTESYINLSFFQFKTVFLITITLILITLIDFHQVLYNTIFKSINIAFDFALLALLSSWLFNVIFSNNFFSFYNYLIFLSIILLLTFFSHFKKQSFQILCQVSPRKLEFQSQTFLLQYFQKLRLLMNGTINPTQNDLQIIKYIQYHRSQCLFVNCPFTKRYQVSKPLRNKIELLEEFVVKSLEKLSISKPLLKKYLLFLLSPDDKVYKYLDDSSSFVRREKYRINSQKKQISNEIRILQAQTIKQQVTFLIEKYLLFGKSFYESLLSQKINCVNFIKNGLLMQQQIQKIQNLKKSSFNFTQQIVILLNNFSSRLIQGSSNILPAVTDPPFLIRKTTDSGPTFLVSAENQNFLCILDVNIACTKQFYHGRETFIKLRVLDLLPTQIKQKHLQHFQIVSKTKFDGKKIFPKALFVFNKLGYISFFTAQVYLINSIKGKIWCVSAEIKYKTKSIILIGEEGICKVMGISEMSIFHGLKIQDKDNQILKQILVKLKEKEQGTNYYKKVIIEAYDKIFSTNDFFFYQTKILQIIEENTAFDFNYFLVEVKSQQQNMSDKNVRSSILRSLNSFQKPVSQIQNNQQQTNFVPKKQFYYHSDGVIRLHSQIQQHIFANFEKFNKKINFQETQQNIEYLGQGITQMRLVDDKLDFLQNIEEQKEFASKPKTEIEIKENQLKRLQIKEQTFLQSISYHKQHIPSWLYRTRLFFILVSLITLSLISVSFAFSNVSIKKHDKDISVFMSLRNNELNYIELTKILINYKHYNQNYTSEDIKTKISEIVFRIQSNSQTIFQISPQIQLFLSQKNVQSNFQNYLIAFNSITSEITNNKDFINTKINLSSIIQNLSLKLVVSFDTIFKNKQQQYFQQNNSLISLGQFIWIGFSLFLLSIVLWVAAMMRMIILKQEKIIQVFLKVNDKYIQREILRLKLFSEHLYFDKDIFDDQDLDYLVKLKDQRSQNKQRENSSLRSADLEKEYTYKRKLTKKKKAQTEKDQEINYQSDQKIILQTQLQQQSSKEVEQNQPNTYKKKLVKKRSGKFIHFFSFLWAAFLSLLSFLLYKQLYEYTNLSQKIIQISLNVNKMQVSSDMVWVLLNNFPYNEDLIQKYQMLMYQGQSSFKKQIINLIKSKTFSQEFENLYLQIWMENCCQYIQSKLSNCRTILNGALVQGGDQIIAYYNRKYDYFMNLNKDEKYFRGLRQTKNLAAIQQNYLSEVVSINNKWLFNEHKRLSNEFQKNIFIYFIFIILSHLVLIGIYKWLSKQKQRFIEILMFFKLIQFENLKKVQNLIMTKFLNERFRKQKSLQYLFIELIQNNFVDYMHKLNGYVKQQNSSNCTVISLSEENSRRR